MLLSLGLALLAIGITVREEGPPQGIVDFNVAGLVLMAIGMVVFVLAIVRAQRRERAAADARRREYEELGVADGHCPAEETVPLRPSFGRWRIFGSPRR